MVVLERVQIGIVGKPNAGKSTFFAAATMKDVKIGPIPFTTVEPNVGIGYVRRECPCRQLRCNPKSYVVLNGVCFIPVELIDVAGLVPGAWQGRGLGNQFLDHIRRAPALLHIVDASGSTDEEGRIVKPGSHDPLRDVEFLERELDMWLTSIIRRDWDKAIRFSEYGKRSLAEVLMEKLGGLGYGRQQVEAALEALGLAKKPPSRWADDDFLSLARELRRGRPVVIVANKVDLPEGEEGYKALKRALPDRIVVPASAEAELALRRAAARGLIRYLPGDADFEVLGNLTQQQLSALERIREVMRKFGGTGVIAAVNAAVFDALKYVVVYPVENEHALSDKNGNVLPDALLVPSDATARDVAYMIHSEIGERFVAAVDATTGKRLSAESKVRDGLIMKIIAR
ncbi:MAG: redox-regulated ATPase YchF [Thermoproteus sp. AZ2]|uniref:Redox-regulated ATPase YchF n=1 Tax=Thermoproteus sp. AZ2 TaxID=1609232 RepID=A0ACC6UZG3_9CREN|nr:MAG: translation-associated GTPase [Thermoproteus sp. AZ2]